MSLFLVIDLKYCGGRICTGRNYSPKSLVSGQQATARNQQHERAMPPQPTTTRRELSPIERAYLVGRHDAGESSHQISHETGVPKSTVIDTIHNTAERGHTNSLPRSRPRKTDLRDNHILWREARKSARSRRIPLAELQANFQPLLSCSTIQRRLKENHISKWLAKGRPMLKSCHKRARYKWAYEHYNWSKEDWEKVLWSDECMVERQTGKGQV